VKIGIIGGTALESLALTERRARVVETSWGSPSGPVVSGQLGRAQMHFINRHGAEHRIPPHGVNYRANIAALHQLGVDGIVAVNAVGGIASNLLPGNLVVPHQIIDYTWGRKHTFSDTRDDTLCHVDFGDPYCPLLRQGLLAAAEAAHLVAVDGAVHGVTQGPRLETAAEILRLERDGCDIVGMTGMPEAGLARELGIPFACLALVVNPAAGKGVGQITMAEIGAVMAASAPRLVELLEAFGRRS